MKHLQHLTEDSLAEALKALPEWQVADGLLVREWTFQNFAEAMAFVNRAAAAAEAVNHHPDIEIRYNKVKLSLISHDAGGITARDLRLAERISKV